MIFEKKTFTYRSPWFHVEPEESEFPAIFERKLKKAWIWSGFEPQTSCMPDWYLSSRPTGLDVKIYEKSII